MLSLLYRRGIILSGLLSEESVGWARICTKAGQDGVTHGQGKGKCAERSAHTRINQACKCHIIQGSIF